MKFWSFVSACCVVALSAVMLALTRGDEGSRPARRMKVVLLFFELLSFPLIKQLTSVFSCTSTEIWMEGEPVCKLATNMTDAQQCMDIDPTVACWGGAHLLYLGFTMLLLTPCVDLACPFLHFLLRTIYVLNRDVHFCGSAGIISALCTLSSPHRCKFHSISINSNLCHWRV